MMHDTKPKSDESSTKVSRISVEIAENGFTYEVFPKETKSNDSMNYQGPQRYVFEDLDSLIGAIKDDLGTPHMKEPPLGSGQRFAALQNKIESRPGFKPRNPGQSKEQAAAAIAASIGRSKYGKARFQSLASRGRKRSIL